MCVVCYYNVIMNRDNFQLRDHGEAMGDFEFLERDMEPKINQVLRQKLGLSGPSRELVYMLLEILRSSKIGFGGYVDGLRVTTAT